MGEQFWTKATPTKGGWYWWRRSIGEHGRVVMVWCDRVHYYGTPDLMPLPSELGGEWWGPLQEPGGDAIENCK